MTKSSLVGVPKSFAQRGIALPFTTPALRYSRLRTASEGGFEALLPSLAGGKGTYVIPWINLSEIVSMSLHDRAVYRAINELREYESHTIRAVALEVKQQGYNGPEEASEAKQQIENEHEIFLMIHFSLVSKALAESKADIHFEAQDLADEDNMNLARKAMSGFAKQVGLTVQQVMDILFEWSQIIKSVGSPDHAYPGYLLNRLSRLAGFMAEIEEWADDETPDVIVKAQKLQDMGELAGRLAYSEVEKLQRQTENISYILKNWMSSKIFIEQQVKNIFGILDGWGDVIRDWESVSGSLRYIQRDKIFDLVKYMPLLPTEILNNNQLLILKDITSPGSGIASLSEKEFSDQDIMIES